jgi:hypothetical protein
MRRAESGQPPAAEHLPLEKPMDMSPEQLTIVIGSLVLQAARLEGPTLAAITAR